MMPYLVEVKNLSKTYLAEGGNVMALKDVSFRVKAGEFITVTGPSGCGKSTLLHLLGGMEVPTGGEILFDSRPLESFGDKELSLFRRSSVGFVFQFFNLLETFTALENVELPLLLAGRSRKETRKKAEKILDQVGLLDQRHRRPHQLSGGEQQRVAIARALVHRPKLLLADEPTGNLDTANGQAVLKILSQVAKSEGSAVLMATHNRETGGIGDTHLFLRDGQVTGLYPQKKSAHG